MKICIVTHKFLLTDGQGRVNYENARFLAAKGHDVTLLSTVTDPHLANLPNITWHEVPIPRYCKTTMLRHQVFGLRAGTILRRIGPFDLVQLNGGSVYYPADVNASHFVHSNWIKSKYHVSKSTSGMYSHYQRLVTLINSTWEKAAYHDSRTVVAVSDFVREGLINDASVDSQKISVIYNGVDTDEFRPLQPGEPNMLRSLINAPDHAFVCFFAGGITTNRKNLDLVLNALSELDDRFHVVVAGTTVRSPYIEMAKRLNIADRAHFLGHRTDVKELLRCADAFSFPSHYDPCPLSVLEAMASGVPPITCPSVGTSRILTNGVDGIILKDDDDLVGLKQSLMQLADDSETLKNMRLRCRRTASEYTWSKMTIAYEELFKSMSQNGSS
jgi:glycosyltransferase involved in cell wall biosynthesis